MNNFIVIGRIEGKENEVLEIKAESREEAAKILYQNLILEHEPEKGTMIYIDYVIDCKDVKPEVHGWFAGYDNYEV